MCVIVVTMRGWADVGLWVAVCFLTKISLHRPTCKTTFARLTQSQAISQAFRVFITFRSRATTFFQFLKLFFSTKLPFPLPWWSKDLLAENLQVAGGQLRNPPVHFRRDCIWRSTCIQYVQMEPGVNSDFGNGSFGVEIRDTKHVDLLTSRCRSTCRSTQVKIYTGLIASTDPWPQEMFTFLEMLPQVESE